MKIVQHGIYSQQDSGAIMVCYDALEGRDRFVALAGKGIPLGRIKVVWTTGRCGVVPLHGIETH